MCITKHAAVSGVYCNLLKTPADFKAGLKANDNATDATTAINAFTEETINFVPATAITASQLLFKITYCKIMV